MAQIKIMERDLTAIPSFAEPVDVVYIPGLPGSTDPSQYAAVAGISSRIGVPTYCRTLSQFQEAFGKYPFCFPSDDYYPYFVAGEETSGFALPSGVSGPSIAYHQGEYEKSYIMACELLQQGIPVLYEALFDVATATTQSVFTEANSISVENTQIVVDTSYTSVDSQYVANIYTALASPILPPTATSSSDQGYFRGLDAVSEYNCKYITTGAYPVFEYTVNGDTENTIAQLMLVTAQKRGDCVALIDHLNIPERELNPHDDTSVYAVMETWLKDHPEFSEPIENSKGEIIDSGMTTYGAMFTPSVQVNVRQNTYFKANLADSVTLDHTIKTMHVPASFNFLYCVAKALQNNNKWLAIAGVTRGLIYNLVSVDTIKPLTNAVADAYQKFAAKDESGTAAINAITNIRSYGQTIWGNRTLKLIPNVEGGIGDEYDDNALTATSFLNQRLILCDVKKRLYTAAKSCMFDNNSDVLWVNFKSKIFDLLDDMRTSNTIRDYKIVQDTSVTERAKLAAIVTIYPIYAVEKFDITVNITDTDVTVQ